MKKLSKIFIFSFLFLFIPLFLEADIELDINFGPQTYENSEVPIILPRATWENSSDLTKLFDWYPEEGLSKNSPPDYFSIDRIIIHDMGCDVKHSGCNDKKINPITTIQNIYRYHAVTRGWGDIGYHYIIDYWGNIYEGRYGGNGVRGAHTYYDRKCDNFNVGSIGVLLMGNYEKTEPSKVMYKSLERLVAWLASTNDLNPIELNHTSEIWHSPKLSYQKTGNGSNCDISQGGLTSTYTGPVIVGHGDIEEGNSDPGLVNLKEVRQEANLLYLKYKNYFYTSKDDSKTYTIKGGTSSLAKLEAKPSNIITLNKNQFDIFSSFKKRPYSDGTLVKSYTRKRVYLIEQNKRRPILSEKLFNLRKFDWSKLQFLSDRDLAAYSLSSPLTYPDGALIKGDGPEVYLIEKGQRKHISSAILFNKMGFKWADVINISQSELLIHPLAEKLLLADNTLIKEKKLDPVYLIKNKERHWIKTSQAFLDLGYKWKDIITLSSDEISYYLMGKVINTVKDLSSLAEEETKDTKNTSDTEDAEYIEEPNIRIGIYEILPKENVKIRANGPYDVYKNKILLASKKTNETIIIPYSKTDFYKCKPQDKDVILEIISYENRPEWNAKINDNRFRESIEIKYSPESKKVWLVNELPLEDYLKGVAETLNKDSTEYLKAFIVAARSYALFHIQNNGKRPGEIFHLRNWSFDQLYKGYGFEERAPNIAKAVEETEGIVALYNDKPIRGVYSSDSGGITKSACDVFKGIFCDNKDYDYLKGGVKDPEGTIHNRKAVVASHGVGMSSAGARQLAKLGKSFEEILKHYYLGIEIEKLY